MMLDDSGASGGPFQIVAKNYDDLWIGRAICWAGYSILVYEFLATVPEELQYVWPRRWTIVKSIFLLNRYGNLVLLALWNAQVSGLWRSAHAEFCFRFDVIFALLFFLSYSSMHVLILLRAWAITDRSRRVMFALASSYVLYFVVDTSLLMVAFVGLKPTVYQDSAVVGTCGGIMTPWLWSIWVPRLFLETGAFIISVIALRWRMFQKEGSTHFLTIYRGGYLYYLIVFCASLLSIFIWAFKYHSFLSLIATTLPLVLTTVSGQRLVLGLRTFGRYPVTGTRDPHIQSSTFLNDSQNARQGGSPIAFGIVDGTSLEMDNLVDENVEDDFVVIPK